jgi:hypothetical protein
MKDLERMRIEREHGVGVIDHRLMTHVNAVEGPTRHMPRPRVGVGKLGDRDAHVMLM